MANSMNRWEPFRDTVTLREAMDRLFEESFVRPAEGSRTPTVQNIVVDIFEKEDALVIKAAVPGVKAEDLDINITGDVLNIKGETKRQEEIEQESYHRQEFSYGSFCRSVRLPVDVDVDQAHADFTDGILTLTLPKPEVKKPHTIAVKVKK